MVVVVVVVVVVFTPCGVPGFSSVGGDSESAFFAAEVTRRRGYDLMKRIEK